MANLLKASYNVEKIGGLDQHIMAIAYVPGPGILHYVGTGEPVADIEGSCGCVDCSKCSKEGCYAIRDYKRFVNYRNACITNTKALRADIDAHFDAIRDEIIRNAIETLRYTQGGELEGYNQFEHVVDLAIDTGIEIYLYTKSYPVLYRFFEDEGRELPENMTVLISMWGDDPEAIEAWNRLKHHAGIKAFVVDNDSIECDAKCPAYVAPAPGKKARLVKEDYAKCGRCKLCTRARNCKAIRCEKH